MTDTKERESGKRERREGLRKEVESAVLVVQDHYRTSKV